jgi:hypothetical protein
MEEKQIWQFHYHRGREMKTGLVRASTAERGYRTAVIVCERAGYRPPAQVFPFIMGDDSILDEIDTAPSVGRGSEFVTAKKY